MSQFDHPGPLAGDGAGDDFGEFAKFHEFAGRLYPPSWPLDEAGVAAAFEQGALADLLPPGPDLAALTEAAVSGLGRLTDDQLTGVLQASRREQNRAAWKQALLVAEFARRRTAELRAAEARGVPVHCRPGEFPGEELAIELVVGPVQASHVIDDATDLATRLPATLAGMASGLIDADRAGIIALHTRLLSEADAAAADAILAAAAPSLRLDQLLRKASALEMKLAPDAVRERRERARRRLQRVEVRREDSGNASVAGREMDTTDALASKAHIHGVALRLRRAGVPGTLDQLRLLVFADLTAGRDPLDRLDGAAGRDGAAGDSAAAVGRRPAAPACAGQADAPDPADAPAPEGPANAPDRADAPASDGLPCEPEPEGLPCEPESDDLPCAPQSDDLPCAPQSDDLPCAPDDLPCAPDDLPCAPEPVVLDYQHDEGGDGSEPGARGGARPPGPVPATINLVVPAGTLFGWDTTPAEAGGWGLLDAGETQDLVAAASRHPATRWCVTVTGTGGTAVAHGCSPGRHPWSGPPGRPARPAGPPGGRGSGESASAGPPGPSAPRASAPARPRAPAVGEAARLARFLRGLGLTVRPVARGSCDHAGAEHRYTPSRTLAHLVRARTAACDAPGCAALAVHADLDHTVPYPAGPTDQCNLGPKCRRHHRVKQAPGWKVEQPRPGVIRWTLPSGRVHVTGPTGYDLTAMP